MSIKKLEQELSMPMFERTNRGIRLTAFGESFLERAAPAVSEFTRLERFVESLKKDASGDIRLGDGKCSYFLRPLADCLACFALDNPSVRLSVTECTSEELCENIDSGSLDVGFDFLPVDIEKFETIHVATIRFQLVISRQSKLTDLSEISFADLSGERFGLPGDIKKLSELITGRCVENGFEPDVYYSSDHPGILTQMVNKNYGVSFCPSADRELLMRAYENVVMPNLVPPLELKVGFVLSRKRKRTKAVNNLISYVLNDNSIA